MEEGVAAGHLFGGFAACGIECVASFVVFGGEDAVDAGIDFFLELAVIYNCAVRGEPVMEIKSSDSRAVAKSDCLNFMV